MCVLCFFGGGGGEISGEVRCVCYGRWYGPPFSCLSWELTDKQAVLGESSYVGGRREGNQREKGEKGSPKGREIDSQGTGKDGLSWKGEKKLLGRCKREIGRAHV